ncbi:MAG: carbamoyl-phosphate synthase large subunit [Bacteriovoracaceae bacterium]|jgi:carbamoyl-phosphate synthase large subunit|nr:carbamoyl-phosphate synthase large subunit [Bacteriovoracaceae bacterium]
MNDINFQQSLRKTKAWLHFEDGTKFCGYINLDINHPKLIEGIWGEAAFTTGMSGYQETMTDPSFLGQHIIFATSHVGNYENDKRVMQSSKIHGTCLIARNFSYNELVNSSDTPLFSHLDTRQLIKFLTSTKLSHKSVITASNVTPKKIEFTNAKLECESLNLVSQTSQQTIISGERPIVLINYGVKNAIIENLIKLKFPLITVPYSTTSEEIKELNPRLIFLSNGPGDPRHYKEEIKTVQELLKLNIPLRGICLGHQLLSLALGAKVIKLPFGQRGINHPVLDQISGDILITSQNHGYATSENSLLELQHNNLLNRELIIQHRSLFDKSVEGICTTDHFLKSVQFHPEANPGPKDAHIFFTEIEFFLNSRNLETIDSSKLETVIDLSKEIKKEVPYKKILLVGSGPIKIGQASEFDYSGTQALKSLKEIGLDVVLLNSNPATIMTDPEMAFATYIEPITKDVIKNIIKKENIDAVLSTMGGQTALNICVELEKESFFKKNGVKLLGANVDTITKTEDRGLFAKEMHSLGYQSGKRFQAIDKRNALDLANNKVGFPLIIRRDFALGGRGSALVWNQKELENVFNETDIKFPITMEKSLVGWKEIELEVMVDCERQGVIICSIENVDPCGIHTGDSITVAPAQTISDRCYQNLRTMSLTIAKHMGIAAGGANVQFAINPDNEDEIVVIEMNPRVSRSSALASKATGYPIAKISALLAVGYTLKEILNDITKASPVAFEPSLDYVAVKIPVFPFNKFPTSSQILGPQMRSVGEVLALGSNFNEAFFKALRSLESGLEIPSLNQLKTVPINMDELYLIDRLKNPYQLSLLTVLEGLRIGVSREQIFDLTKISPWFISQIELFIGLENEIKESPDQVLTDVDFLREIKLQGLSDKFIALLIGKSQHELFDIRFKHKVFPVYKAVDTCSGEFKALTPYFYSTYLEFNEAFALSKKDDSMVILGSGPNRIGQGIEFDYSCVKSCQHLSERNIKSIMINSNPETVSTDYDSSDRLYLSPLYSEDLYDIFINEMPKGIITCFSGQTGIKIRAHIEESFRNDYHNFSFLGSTLKTLDLTEDRKLFADITKQVSLSHTKSKEVSGYKNFINAIVDIGLPVMIRPSYVIGGESMYILTTNDDINELPDSLKNLLKNTNTVFQVENYLENSIEYDVDLIRDSEGNTVFTVCEHIEYAGVHSGDSGMISPPVALTQKMYHQMKKISEELATLLEVIGPVNIQYAVKGDKVYCIEANPRGSRTLPFLSKAYNISLPSIATDAMLGKKISNWDRETSNYFCVKQSTFPFDRFHQDNIILGPKMRSTGETFGIDKDKEAAVLKSYLGNYPKISNVGKILISMADNSKEVLLPYLKSLHKMGYQFYATSGTCSYIKKQGISCTNVAKINESGITILEVLKDDQMVMVFNTPMNQGVSRSDGENIRNTAIQYGVPCFTRQENIKAVIQSLVGQEDSTLTPYSLQEIHGIVRKESSNVKKMSGTQNDKQDHSRIR